MWEQLSQEELSLRLSLTRRLSLREELRSRRGFLSLTSLRRLHQRLAPKVQTVLRRSSQVERQSQVARSQVACQSQVARSQVARQVARSQVARPARQSQVARSQVARSQVSSQRRRKWQLRKLL